MLYLIKSPKWTRHYKKDTYWGTNQCGYVTIIADAGFYEEDEAQSILRLSGGNGAELVPVTKEIIDKANRQLCKRKKELLESRKREEERHRIFMNDFDKKLDANENSFELIKQLGQKLRI